MTPEQSEALRKPFPAAAVGKLPKPYKADSAKGNCRECGGFHGMPAVHLDYVGHAAVTDRLREVDPEWSWEPFAVDERGLPALDQKGNLWIRLTVGGTTRIGVGDGRNAKEVIGDAIRNAAMRFGVALDLWAKEDLHAMDEERGTVVYKAAVEKPPKTESTGITGREAKPAEPPAADEAPTLSLNRQKKLFALFKQKGVPEADQLRGIAAVLERPIESRTAMSVAEFDRVIASLEAFPDAASADTLPEPPEEPW